MAEKQLRLNEHDEDIFELFETRSTVMVEDVVQKYNRNRRSAQAGFKRLVENGILIAAPVFEGRHFKGYAYSIPVHARQRVTERIGGKKVFVRDDAPKDPDHEVTLGRIADAAISQADAAGFEPPFIERRKKFLHDSVTKDGEKISINPDLFIALKPKDRDVLLIMQFENEGKLGRYREGKSQQDRKMAGYFHYRNSGRAKEFWAGRNIPVHDFKTGFGHQTTEKRNNWARRNLIPFRYRMFWGAANEDLIRDFYGDVWITPAEFNSSYPEESPRTGFKNLVQSKRPL
ncbi:MAG: hypothetical protein Q8L86_12380 [Vicinamibacterales bacterium]|nr:hypothetical protein [Vicinamibacterales bacterium]